ncbi:SDR family oxidoreductase [Haladaptatus pallidirubidus]|nr:SDR family oxidoreductase [Haladaptatus pallidirubidus]
MKPVPLGRAERPSDIAGTALFFATDKADYITGEIVYVDGGWQLF